MSNTSEKLEARHFETMLNTLDDMVRVVTREGKIAYTNKAYDRKLAGGLSTIGNACYELYGNRDGCKPCISNQVIETRKMRQTTRHIGDRVYTVTASPLTDELTGEVLGTIEVFRDITLDFNIRSNLVSQSSKWNGDLQMARRVQRAMTNNVLPDVEGYNLYVGYFPCEAVGGDIYDCILADDKLIMYVADASGHGVTPAMLAVFFSRAIRTACMMGRKSPADILTYVQNEFTTFEIPSELYITGFLVVLDLPTGDYVYTNAGLSVEPIVYHDGAIEELCMYSPPIARWERKKGYETQHGHLDPSDRLLIYTDGLNQVQTSEEVLQQLYDQFSVADFDAEEFIRGIRRDMLKKVVDDLTLLVCTRSAGSPEGA